MDFFGWYNTEHRHSGLAMLTPQDVHYDLAEQRLAKEPPPQLAYLHFSDEVLYFMHHA